MAPSYFNDQYMPAENDLFKAIESHLAYFGYRTKSEDGILKAVEGYAVWEIHPVMKMEVVK